MSQVCNDRVQGGDGDICRQVKIIADARTLSADHGLTLLCLSLHYELLAGVVEVEEEVEEVERVIPPSSPCQCGW